MFSRSRRRERTRVPQGTPLRTGLAKATVLTALERIGGMTQAQPYPGMPSCRKRGKKPNPTDLGGNHHLSI